MDKDFLADLDELDQDVVQEQQKDDQDLDSQNDDEDDDEADMDQEEGEGGYGQDIKLNKKELLDDAFNLFKAQYRHSIKEGSFLI